MVVHMAVQLSCLQKTVFRKSSSSGPSAERSGASSGSLGFFCCFNFCSSSTFSF